MRNAMARLGGNPEKINPLVPADLVVDHSVQVDYARDPDALAKNLNKEMERNSERFQFLKWSRTHRQGDLDDVCVLFFLQIRRGPVVLASPREKERELTEERGRDAETIPRQQSNVVLTPPLFLCMCPARRGSKSFSNFLIVPPGSGIVHQVNLEYLARVVFEENNVLYPDSLVGTDSHTTMINGLGVAGWGVGGIEAESVMLGQAVSMVLPEVIGYRLVGRFPTHCTATDLVLTITEKLRARGVVDKFVEFVRAHNTLSWLDVTLLRYSPSFTIPSLSVFVAVLPSVRSWSGRAVPRRSCDDREHGP